MLSTAVKSHVLLAGLARFVPVPILDDWLYRKALRRAIAEDAVVAGVALDEPSLDVLTADRSSMLVGCLKALVVWPLKKLFRTVFWFLTVKDVIDAWALATETIALVGIARSKGWFPAHATSVRDAVDASFDRHRWSPVTRFVMRYERGDIGEERAPDFFGRLLQSLRKHSGAASIESMFVERASAQIAAAPAALAQSGATAAMAAPDKSAPAEPASG